MSDEAPRAICPARQPGQTGYPWSTEADCYVCHTPVWLSQSMRDMGADPVCFTCGALGMFAAGEEPTPAPDFFEQGRALGFTDEQIDAILVDLRRKLQAPSN